jgi:hypothetical protein
MRQAGRIAELATDTTISVKTVYRYLHEGIDVLAAHAPTWDKPSPQPRGQVCRM